MGDGKPDNAVLVRVLEFAGIRAGRYETIQEYWFAKSVFVYSNIGLLLAVFYASFYWLFEAKAAAVSLLLLIFVMVVTFPLHRQGRTRLYAKINLAATNTALAGVVLHMGGIDSSVSCWLLGVIPGLAALLFRSAREIIYLTLYTLGLYAVVFLFELNGYPVYQFGFPQGSLVERGYTFFNFSISALFTGMALSVFSITQTRLYHKLEHQSRDAKAILSNIHQGIFTIRTGLLVNDDYSQHLEVLLNETDIRDRNALDLVFRSSHLSNDQIAALQSILEVCIGESALNFSLNQASLVRELTYRTRQGETKNLLVDWRPVVDDETDVIEKMLVTLRDVTELKVIQSKVSKQQNDIDMICEIVDVETDRFERFMRSCTAFVEENKRLIDGMAVYDPDVMKILFINLHTMKGVARSYHLHRMTSVIHDCEQGYAQVQKKDGGWDQKRARDDIDKVEGIIAEYQKVNREKLRRSDQTGTLKIEVAKVRENIRALQSIEGRPLDEKLLPFVDTVKETFYGLYYLDIDHLFVEICECLPSLARDLCKQRPEVEYRFTPIGITAEGGEVLRNIFIHFLRNSMDHGIETASMRMQVGKDPAGRLSFESYVREDGFLVIRFEDDGQGLALDRLHAAARKGGFLPAEAEKDPQKLANLIFIHGFSTNQKVSEISGRGMGMAAAAGHAERIGGSVKIVLREIPRDLRPVAFYHEVILPPSVYTVYEARKYG